LCVSNHPLIDEFDVYTWGEGKFGRLGHNSERNEPYPRLVEALRGKNPRQANCGGFHTAVVTSKFRVLTKIAAFGTSQYLMAFFFQFFFFFFFFLKGNGKLFVFGGGTS
jgi:alpha-tubulin suppressor-like RCC1 family protein